MSGYTSVTSKVLNNVSVDTGSSSFGLGQDYTSTMYLNNGDPFGDTRKVRTFPAMVTVEDMIGIPKGMVDIDAEIEPKTSAPPFLLTG